MAQLNNPQSGMAGSPWQNVGSTVSAIMTVDPYGNLLPAVLTGLNSIQTDPLHAASPIANINFSGITASGGQDGYAEMLNSSGQFVYTAILQDGRTVVAVGKVVLGGDANGDGIVNGQDIGQVASHWLQHVTPGTDGDVNFDGIVNGQDLAMIGSDWLHTYNGGPPGPVAPVPEPGTLWLAIVAVCGLLVPCYKRLGTRRR